MKVDEICDWISTNQRIKTKNVDTKCRILVNLMCGGHRRFACHCKVIKLIKKLKIEHDEKMLAHRIKTWNNKCVNRKKYTPHIRWILWKWLHITLLLLVSNTNETNTCIWLGWVVCVLCVCDFSRCSKRLPSTVKWKYRIYI